MAGVLVDRAAPAEAGADREQPVPGDPRSPGVRPDLRHDRRRTGARHRDPADLHLQDGFRHRRNGTGGRCRYGARADHDGIGRRAHGERPGRTMKRAAIYALLALVVLFAAFPIVYMLVTSLKTRAMLYDPAMLVFTPTFENYRATIEKYGLQKYLLDSLIVASANVAV